MKKIFSVFFLFFSFTVFSQNLGNPAVIGQTNRNQKVGKGFQITDTLLVNGKVRFSALPAASTGDTSVLVTDPNGYTSKVGKVSFLTGSFPTATSTTTFTNKRITARVDSTTSSATPTINTDNVDTYRLTAQAADITSFTTNLTGTPTDDQILHIVIIGTAARAITWGSKFESSTVTLPTTTVTTNRLDVYFIWNTATQKWRCGGTW